MKGTGVLEEHSDVCILLNFPSKYDISCDPTEFHVHLDKNKMGITTSFKMKYYADMNLFTEEQIIPESKKVNISCYETSADWEN